jgi:meso-butanediol dehydrogenase / (S,S)-butanediol dehydrogenase / diacetyl reductase
MSGSDNSPRVAVVTGCAGNLGKAIALRLADDGLDIVLNDLASRTDDLQELKKEIEAKGRRGFVFVGNVSEEAAVESLVNTVVANMGHLDVVRDDGIKFRPLLRNLVN